jgi:hypothetical protein
MKKKILVSGYSSTLSKYLRKQLFSKVVFYNYKNYQNKKFFCFIHFAVINKINPSYSQILQEKKVLNKCIKICRDQRIKKFILLSTYSVKNLNTNYEKMKKALEKQIKKTNLDYLILRPTKIINKKIFKYFFYLNKFNFLFLSYKLQKPIFFECIKKILCKILKQKKFRKKTYSINSNLSLDLNNVKKIKNFKTFLKFYNTKIKIF